MARGSRCSKAVALALCAGAALQWGGAFTGAPLSTSREVSVARAGKAKDGPFTPTVVGFKVLMGEENLNSFRNAMIKLHGEAQAAAIDTHESGTGQAIMEWLFNEADADGNGTIDKEELVAACQRLGFEWMDDKRAEKLMKKADKNEDGVIELEEFKTTAPKFFKQSTLKLAKKNGADLGFLS